MSTFYFISPLVAGGLWGTPAVRSGVPRVSGEQRNSLLRFAEESGYDVVGRYEDTGGYPEEDEEIA